VCAPRRLHLGFAHLSSGHTCPRSWISFSVVEPAASLGEVVTAHVIARPDEAVDKVIVSKKPAPKASPKAK
ncbi:MAG: hypothetical protein MK312_10330, partial [Roseibacillus sp.]|nr:hypothetical protein [Roseibacillus sp.]